MNLEKVVEIGMLFEHYKELLTDKQKEIVSLYYDYDYSLGEISENLNVSRQGVYDTLKRSEKILREYESKVKLIERLYEKDKFIEETLNKVVDIKENLRHNRDCVDLIPKLENIEDTCREMLK